MIIVLQAMNNTYYYHHLPYIVMHSYSKYANKFIQQTLSIYTCIIISYNYSCYDKNKKVNLVY